MKIIVYDDSPVFGGHQVMACRGVEALAATAENEILYLYHLENHRLRKHLETIPRIQTAETSAGLKQLKARKPDCMLCIQGDPRQAVTGLRAAKRAGIPTISYIALPHSLAAMGAKLGRLRDRFEPDNIHLPDRYITLSKSMKQLLRDRGAKQPIDIVPNGIPLPPPPPSRTAHDPLTLGMLGRIEFNQKQQDFAVRTFCTQPGVFRDCRLLITGDGPDFDRLEEMILGHDHMELRPWQTDTEAFYAEIDYLLLPSRFEGMPLVMLEALARGIPVIGSACDGMKDLLPEPWTFEPGNSEALAKTFAAVRNHTDQFINMLQQRVHSEMSIDTFKTNFAFVVGRDGPPGRPHGESDK